MSRLLIVDACPERRRTLAGLVADEPLTSGVGTAPDLNRALHQLLSGIESKQPYSVAFYHLPNDGGGEEGDRASWNRPLCELWSIDPELQVVLCVEPDDHVELEDLGEGFHHKLLLLRRPYDPLIVRQMVRTLTEKWTLARRDRDRFDELECYRTAIEEERHNAESLQESYGHLEKAHAVAQAATRAKSEFLANMSHEIRTPMTAILGYADLLRDPELTRGDHHTYLNVIRRNGDHLLELINDVLDLSKIEAGRMTIEQVETSPEDILDEVRSLMLVRARKKQLDFEVGFEGPTPKVIVTDPTRVRQILLNLVSNAIKFTPHGSVELSCTMTHAEGDEAGETGKLSFSVRDTGIGLGPDELASIFAAFSQGDNSTTRRFGGTGLGLAISKRLAGMLGGDIRVESEPGKGSVFTLTIRTGNLAGVELVEHGPATEPKLDPEDLAVKAAVAAGRGEGLAKTVPTRNLTGRILLAEDGRDNQLLITHYLKKAGASVVVADDGALALSTATEHGQAPADQGFDLILMDMQMPKLDGYEVTRQLRVAGWSGPIVALTAHAMPGDREKCLEAGCDEYLTKPIDRAMLIDLCARMIAPEEPLAPLPKRFGKARELRVRGRSGRQRRSEPS